MLVGQSKLLKGFTQSLQTGTMPQFIILEGVNGSGRTTMAEWIAEQLGAFVYTLEELKVDAIRDVIADAQNLSMKTVYIIQNGQDMTAQAENALLKLAEEPPKNCYIIMTVDNRASVLPTIQSRGKVYKMQPYSTDELMEFTKDIRLIKICEVPGKILNFVDSDMEALFKFADKVLEKLGDVSVMNLLAIPNYLNVDGKNQDRYDLEMFFDVLVYRINARIKSEKSERKLLLELLYPISNAKSMLRIKSSNKQAVVDTMLIKMRRAVKTQ